MPGLRAALYGPAAAEARRGSRPGSCPAPPAGPPTTRSSRRSADAQAGRVDAIATAPVNKEAFAHAGLPWKGHTDLLGAPDRAPHAR